ncbi:hypothetical protein [Aneurinibacillus danicus]|jgi:hypothetical protein|uniref:Uncharacterized protein n=1 Tax=Aneurinibacillus danicus TaxID=267746 RepID=A0A511V461_9BACL|nr:hypothetical protein [Aneurinibacillus danicus]GEN33710.1 hypothetical protein ADA01nite_11700 [Aneurinibacillus danicus]
MNSQKRRSPYTKRSRRTAASGKKRKKAAPVVAKKEAATAIVPVKNKTDLRAASAFMKNLPSILTKSPEEMRTSINTVREWSTQMRGTMAEMEQTLSTLTNLIGMYERWSKSSQKRAMLRAAEQGSGDTGERSALSFIKSLNNVDFRQIISLLNSPLVQALLEMDEIATSSEEA